MNNKNDNHNNFNKNNTFNKNTYLSLPKNTPTPKMGLFGYLLHAAPNVRVWHKAFLRWVRSEVRSQHASSIAKNTFGPVCISLNRGASRGKSLGGGPLRPEEISSQQARSVPQPGTADQSVAHQLENQSMTVLITGCGRGICHLSHHWTSMAQGCC